MAKLENEPRCLLSFWFLRIVDGNVVVKHDQKEQRYAENVSKYRELNVGDHPAWRFLYNNNTVCNSITRFTLQMCQIFQIWQNSMISWSSQNRQMLTQNILHIFSIILRSKIGAITKVWDKHNCDLHQFSLKKLIEPVYKMLPKKMQAMSVLPP